MYARCSDSGGGAESDVVTRSARGARCRPRPWSAGQRSGGERRWVARQPPSTTGPRSVAEGAGRHAAAVRPGTGGCGCGRRLEAEGWRGSVASAAGGGGTGALGSATRLGQWPPVVGSRGAASPLPRAAAGGGRRRWRRRRQRCRHGRYGWPQLGPPAAAAARQTAARRPWARQQLTVRPLQQARGPDSGREHRCCPRLAKPHCLTTTHAPD